MRTYKIVIEKTGRKYSAYAPHLPGCVATGATRLKTLERMQTAIAMHLKGLEEDDALSP